MRGFVRAIAAAALLAGAGVAAVGSAAPAGAAISGCADNVRWGTTTSTTMNGTFGDNTTVTLTLSAGGGNSGTKFDTTWGTIDATNEAFATGVDTRGSVAIYGDSGGGTTVTVAFGSDVTNPVVFTNFIDDTTLTFTGSITLLDSNPTVTPSGSTVSINGGNSGSAGFAVQVSGTFGPSTGPLVFTYTNSSPDTMGITIVKAGGSGGDCAGPACVTEGFASPVAMGGTVNVVKAGSTVPLKFRSSCDGIPRGDLSVVSSFSRTVVTCPSGAPTATPATTSGPTKLVYDRQAAQYSQNWQTPKSPRNICYEAKVTLVDGNSLVALFRTR